jgi:hypothetical protein
LARRKASAFPSYQSIGEELQENARFTYLYPAQQIGDEWRAWLPCYQEGKGLVWRREDQMDAEPVPDHKMRTRLLSTQAGTAIDPTSDTAAEGTLRETECVTTHWRDVDQDPPPRVAMVGYVFLRDGSSLKDDLEAVRCITIGGDTRYGLGRLCRIPLTRKRGMVRDAEHALGGLGRIPLTSSGRVFDLGVELKDDDPIVYSSTVYAHAVIPPNKTSSDDAEEKGLIGNREMLVGWDSAKGGGLFVHRDPLWVPGSTVAGGETKCAKWKVRRDGLWEAVR